MSGNVFCTACSKPIDKSARTCPHCGAVQPPRGGKRRVLAGSLALMLGGLGIHRFYLGQLWGLFYLLFCWTLVPALIAIIEGVVILLTDQERWDEKYNGGVPSGSGGFGLALLLAVLLAFPVMAMVGILAAIAIPAYQQYVLRASVHDAFLATRVLQDELAEKN